MHGVWKSCQAARAKIADYLDNVRGVIGACVQAMPTHEAFIARHCAAQA